MCDEWLDNMDNGKLTGVIFLDIRKAFDSINHDILLKKINNHFGFTGIHLKWFESYLNHREQQCFVNGQTSSPMKIICWVPQGSTCIFGPSLFFLHLNNMSDCLKSTSPCLCAYDTQIFSSSYESDELLANLNSYLINIRNWLVKDKLQIHQTKSKRMFIGSSYNLKNKTCDQPVLDNNQSVPIIDAQKCLGVFIDEKRSWQNI